MGTSNPKYWIVVASRDHVAIGVKGGFIQANHGKLAPMKRLNEGDYILCYSSKKVMTDTQPYQMFTAMGQVVDHQAYQASMKGGTFQPFRRAVTYWDCREAPVKPLIPHLSFIKDARKWGFPFMRGFFEISPSDFELITKQMQCYER